MIAKFRTNDGWAFMQCDQALTKDKLVTTEEFNGSSYFLFGMENTSEDKFKQVVLTHRGECNVVLYGYDAYLCNDKGDTINML
jgi:hypothetical protein